MSLKEEVLVECQALLSRRISDLQEAMMALSGDAAGDSKSTAGDKHETGRAMMHLEQEKLSTQLNLAQKQIALLERLSIIPLTGVIVPGTLIRTDQGYFYLSVALGRIQIEGQDVFVLSPESPLGKSFLNKKEGECISLQNRTYQILEIE